MGLAWQLQALTLKAPSLSPLALVLGTPQGGIRRSPCLCLTVWHGPCWHLVGVGPAVLAQKQLESRAQRGSPRGGAGGGARACLGPAPPLRLMWPEAFDPCPDITTSVSGVAPLVTHVERALGTPTASLHVGLGGCLWSCGRGGGGSGRVGTTLSGGWEDGWARGKGTEGQMPA